MDKFVELDVSFFSPGFTLSPEQYLQDLYPRKDILGFSSEGMNFVFRFDGARAVMYNKQCVREPLANPEIAVDGGWISARITTGMPIELD